MRTTLWLPLVLTACTSTTPPPERDPNDPYAWLRCRETAKPALSVQDTLLGTWNISFREGYGSDTAAVGEMSFKLLAVRPDISSGQHVCKDCLWGEYYGLFPPQVRRPPDRRNHLAIMRGDHTFVMSMGSASLEPNRGDLSFCGAMLDDSLSGLWWQNLPDGPWGTFVMWRR